MGNLLAGLFCFLLCSCYVVAQITINEIIGPEYVEHGSVDELIFDCDFDAKDEPGVVVKWFLNGQEEQIYQWIIEQNTASAMGPLKNLIDPTYKVSDDRDTMLRALKFTEISPAISGNYTCKVTGDNTEASSTKPLIVYSPATSFEMILINGNESVHGDEVILCDVTNVSPKPNFQLYVQGENGSLSERDTIDAIQTKIVDSDGFYNISLTYPFNSSYYQDGSTKFTCDLSIPGTNYSEVKSVEHFVDSGVAHLQCSLLPILLFSLILTT